MSDETDNPQNRNGFGERLRLAISGRYTQDALAEEVGSSLSGVKKWLSGEHEPRASVAWQIARLCDVCPEWLIAGEGPMRPGEATEAAPATTPAEPESLDPEKDPKFLLTCKLAGALLELLRKERMLRDTDSFDFYEFLLGMIEIECEHGVPGPDFQPSVAKYRRMVRGYGKS